MSKAKDKPAVSNPKTLRMAPTEGKTAAQTVAALAVSPSISAATVVDSYQRNIMGDDVDMTALVESLQETTDKAKAGDLSNLEAMLIGQATALQTIFTSLAKRAVHQDMMAHYESFLGLALKAQAQSRATISALVDLKYPRQATFVKQANIANGPQQVNNGAAAPSHAREFETPQNELLEAQHGNYLDTGAQSAASRANSHLEAVG